MSDTATKQDLTDLGKKLDKKVDRAVDEILSVMHTFMKQVDERFTEQDQKFNKLLNTIDGFIAGLISMKQSKQHAITNLKDSWYGRAKVSKKTGIPLENL